MPPKETSCHSRLGASRIRPSLRRTRPGTLIPMPTSGAVGGASSTTATDERGHGRTHLPGLAVAVHRRLRPLQHLAAEADPGDDRTVDAEVHGDDVGTLGREPDPGGGTAGALPGTPDRGRALGDAQRLQLRDEPGDGAPVEPHQARQLCPRDLARAVDVPQERAEVVAPDGLLVGAEARAPLRSHVST